MVWWPAMVLLCHGGAMAWWYHAMVVASHGETMPLWYHAMVWWPAMVVPCHCGTMPWCDGQPWWYHAMVVPCHGGAMPWWCHAMVVPCHGGAMPWRWPATQPQLYNCRAHPRPDTVSRYLTRFSGIFLFHLPSSTPSCLVTPDTTTGPVEPVERCTW